MGLRDKLKAAGQAVQTAAYQAATEVHKVQHGSGTTEKDILHPAGEEGRAILDRIRNGNHPEKKDK